MSEAQNESAQDNGCTDTFVASQNAPVIPTIHVVSDSIGATAQAVARAAASQFGETNPRIEMLPMVKSSDDVLDFLEEQVACHKEAYGDDRILVFYTLVNKDTRQKVQKYVADHPNIIAVDLLGDALSAIESVTGRTPANEPGSLRVADINYFRRIDAIEFTIAHDDGRNPQDLVDADIVLIGVSRSSKTPLSIYLAQQGFKVANVPIDPISDPPSELYAVDRTRLFGLTTTPEVLLSIRQRRLGHARIVASNYADVDYIYQDLEHARELMKKLGCIIIHTENRAVEETAQEILHYYERSHPPVPGIPDIIDVNS